ncbi:olfactory receptor 13C9-like [Rhinatrema bivittatum]|uniref:olfactory receptor 13C9-like n=1 Tax=Rhinatrema bivittatum TaxID=194408 RepID=UPI00112A6528|nr:olfactory receptor 13C9-like [Rhinatrema bivittatum]
MALENQTLLTGFIFLGFSDLSPQLQRFLLAFFFLFYILAVIGNLLIFITLTLDPVLHTPMYFFLRNLSFLDICFMTVTVPKTLAILMAEDRSISFLGCALQMYFTFFLGSEEFVLLGIMAYDRYVAICNPLHYSTVMNKKRCAHMAVGSWIMCAVLQFGQTSFIFSLSFCRSKVIYHFYCDVPAVMRLSCTNTYWNNFVQMILSVFFLLLPFLVIVSSYVYIISTVLRMHCKDGRSKAFSTCSSHLAVVTLFYGTAMLACLKPNTSTSDERGFAIFNCFVSPMLNPLIYSLRSKEVKEALRRRIWGKMQFLYRQ